MFSFLEITDGTVTTACELTDNIDYALVGYAPIVSPLRESLLGDGVYSEVTETITVHAMGCTAALAYAAADKLNRLLDQAWRWWQGENVAAVNIRAMAQDSTILAPLAAAVKGRAPAGPANIALPAIWNEYFGKYVIQNITIQFVRRGQWIGVDDATATSTPAANPSVHLVSFSSSHLTSSPFDLVLSGFNFVTTPVINAGFLGVGSQLNDVVIANPTGGTAANWTVFADAANLPGSGILRYTPVATTPSTSGDILIGGREGLVAVIAKVRNNSATTTWLVTGKFEDAGGNITSMRPVEIDTSTLNPRIVVLGVAVVNQDTNILTLTAQASAVSGTLDFDGPMIVNLRDETCAVIAHDAAPIGGLVGNFTANFSQDPLEDTAPSVQLRDVAPHIVPVGYRGALPLNTIGQDVYAAWYATNANFWTFTNVSNAKVNVAIQATRHRAYLIPQ